MSRQVRTSEPFHWIETILAHISKPFYKAESLDKYKTAGYLYIFGPFMLFILLVLWFLGYLTSSLNQLPLGVRSSIEWLLEAVHLKSLPQLPMILLICLVY